MTDDKNSATGPSCPGPGDKDQFIGSGSTTSVIGTKRDLSTELDSKWAYYKQVLALGVGWMFLFMALVTLRNLQSSINHIDGLGLISMGTFYGGMMVGSFVSSAIVQTLGPKTVLVGSTVFHIAFVAANFYPNLPLLATVGAVAGVSHSSLWAAQSTYLTTLAKSFSAKYNAAFDYILARFFGLAFLFSEASMLIGNPLATLLLSLEDMLYSKEPFSSGELNAIAFNISAIDSVGYTYSESVLEWNRTASNPICGRHYCHSYVPNDSVLHITDWTRYVVVGAFSVSAALALLIFIIFIDDRHVYVRRPGCSDLPAKLIGTLHCILDVKTLLLSPFTIYYGFQMAYVSGDVVKAYVSCASGIPHVGKVMLCYGALDATSSLLAGWLKKYIGSIVTFCIIVALNVAMFAAVILWSPGGGVWSYIVFSGFGAIQGFTNIHINGQIGYIFRENVESAFSVYRLFLGLGLSAGFTYSPYFCMDTKIWVAVTLFVIATVCYCILEIVHRVSLRKYQSSTEKTVEVS